MFDTAAQAIGDLARCLDDGEAGERGPQAATLLRALRRPRDLVVHLDASWVCVVYQVDRGAHLTDVADAVFAQWRQHWFARRFEFLNANRPVIC
ncbi:hypothetical protein GCM10010452_62450 [Crossiella cryophila]